MSLFKLVLSLALVLAVLSWVAQREPPPQPTIPARELLDLTQHASKASYTFDRTTSSALATVQVPRPPEDASRADLESALREAGFDLRPVGRPEKQVFLVEQSGG